LVFTKVSSIHYEKRPRRLVALNVFTSEKKQMSERDSTS